MIWLFCNVITINLDRSDEIFNELKGIYHLSPSARFWKYIVMGNMAKNQLLRKNFSLAAPLFKEAADSMFAYGDPQYAFDVASLTSVCFSLAGEKEASWNYIQLADTCRTLRWEVVKTSDENLFRAKCAYYSSIGKTDSAYVYLDSAIIGCKNHSQRYNLENFLYMERQTGAMELKEKAMESEINRQRSTIFLITSIIMFFSEEYASCSIPKRRRLIRRSWRRIRNGPKSGL